ncbi:hypothetical protein [Nonomuraea dietziae]|uniref:hypothetical protein n=1 Tax=Nonomuraea dietziae TaxID=65515 RepID=UPI00340AD411
MARHRRRRRHRDLYPVLEAVRHLLQFGASVEVTGPPEARAELLRASAEIAEMYGAA